MKLWGHSHVNMGVSASSQDDKQIKELKANTDFFIRVIMNKKDEIKIDIIDDDVVVENADFAEINNNDVTNLLKLIEEAKAQIEEIKLKREEELAVEVKKEVKEKVREKRSERKILRPIHSYNSSDKTRIGWTNSTVQPRHKKKSRRSKEITTLDESSLL